MCAAVIMLMILLMSAAALPTYPGPLWRAFHVALPEELAISVTSEGGRGVVAVRPVHRGAELLRVPLLQLPRTPIRT